MGYKVPFKEPFRNSSIYQLKLQKLSGDMIFRCVRISIRGLVRRFVGRSVGRSVGNAFVKINETWTLTHSKWIRQCWMRKKEDQGGRRDEEQEGREVRRDEESITRSSEANDASFSDFFIFHFLATFSFFYSPRHSLLLVPLFSSSSTVWII